jgi:hypothetical protein
MPAAIAERRHPFIAVKHKVPLLLPSAQKVEMKADPASHIAKLEELKDQKQMLMYGHVDLPTENFSFKWESGAPQCEDGCAFQDKVFTVEVSACEKDASRCLHERAREPVQIVASNRRARSLRPFSVRHPASIFSSSGSSSGDICVL